MVDGRRKMPPAEVATTEREKNAESEIGHAASEIGHGEEETATAWKNAAIEKKNAMSEICVT